ncbi:hypothetical protein HD554DRAFT_2165873 [Boletus coccyginus]|nr:hypothetical protein HD554DRAFT_2165873 [Boletus coccyginus]
MTTPLAFLPRAVLKYTKEWQGISRSSPSPSPSPSPPPTPSESKGKERAIEPAHPKQHGQDIASLISLALSDYNIWLDPDLRSKLEACLRDDSDEAGFVPINYLLRRPPFRGALPPVTGQPDPPSETEVVKALRTHARHTLEVRMCLPSSVPPSSVWYGTGKTSRKKDVGGYQVRRRDWATLRDRPSRGWTRARWDDMTAYMECIPPQYRTLGGIARFAESLLSETEADADAEPRLRVQCVTLPPHYLDKPGDTPKCKGYALVTFSTKSHLEALLQAFKYGLRAISKARWNALNEEYLAYKHALVSEMTRTDTDMYRPDQGAPAPDHEHGEPTALPHPHPQPPAQTTPFSPYPFDCLVFTKTQTGSGHAPAGVDYVDFNRGMDTCYLRLASPDHATQLTAYFDARPRTQAHGLDATGRTPLQDDKPITTEKVQGKKEELYWKKVPEKVRRQAVDKVIQAQLASTAGSSDSPSDTVHHSGASGSGLKRTREV